MTAPPPCWNTEEKVVFCPELGYNKSIMDKRPVGIFDSGLGGLTAVSALHALLPEENIIYFGDTARNPYGTRPPEQLRKMARENLDLMASFNVKAVIAACGTMSILPPMPASAAAALPAPCSFPAPAVRFLPCPASSSWPCVRAAAPPRRTVKCAPWWNIT